MTLRVLSYNIRYGGTGREAELLTVIRSAAPDLVVFQEATQPGGDRAAGRRARR